MSTEATEQKDIWGAIWEIQDVLQKASTGDHDVRCYTSVEAHGTTPLTSITPAISLLLEDLMGKRRKQEKAEAQLKANVPTWWSSSHGSKPSTIRR